MKSIIWRICLLVGICLGTVWAYGSDIGDPGGDPDAPEIPLDGGLSLLLAGGAAYGVYVVKRKRNEKSS